MKIASLLLVLLPSPAVSAFVVWSTTATAAAPLQSAAIPSTSSTTRLMEGISSVSSAKELSARTADVTTIFTTEDIDRILPHRYPFALVDKVVEYEAGVRAVGIKGVTKVRWREE